MFNKSDEWASFLLFNLSCNHPNVSLGSLRTTNDKEGLAHIQFSTWECLNLYWNWQGHRPTIEPPTENYQINKKNEVSDMSIMYVVRDLWQSLQAINTLWLSVLPIYNKNYQKQKCQEVQYWMRYEQNIWKTIYFRGWYWDFNGKMFNYGENWSENMISYESWSNMVADRQTI